MNVREKITFETFGHAGDWLCLVSAAHLFAKSHPEYEVHVSNLGDVAEAYRDGLVQAGVAGRQISVNAVHREKHHSSRHNYYGTFLREILPEIVTPQNLELPQFPRESQISVLQPYSNYASNPPKAYVQAMVDHYIELTGDTVFAIGHPSTPRDLDHVDYSLLQESIPELLRHIARARFVLTPRSCTAHAAAGYCVPAFVWLCDDGENWHLNYPGWPVQFHEFKSGLKDGLRLLASAVSDLSSKWPHIEESAELLIPPFSDSSVDPK